MKKVQSFATHVVRNLPLIVLNAAINWRLVRNSVRNAVNSLAVPRTVLNAAAKFPKVKNSARIAAMRCDKPCLLPKGNVFEK